MQLRAVRARATPGGLATKTPGPTEWPPATKIWPYWYSSGTCAERPNHDGQIRAMMAAEDADGGGGHLTAVGAPLREVCAPPAPPVGRAPGPGGPRPATGATPQPPRARAEANGAELLAIGMADGSAFAPAGGAERGRTLRGYSGDATVGAATECARLAARATRAAPPAPAALTPFAPPTAADRRTPYSLLGRATLGVRVTHEKLRLGGGPHGAHPRCRARARARADCARRRRPVFDVQARRHPDPVGHAAAARGPLPLRPLHRHRCATPLAAAPQPRPAARSHEPRVRRRLLPDPHLRRHLRGRLGQPAPRGL